MRFIFFIYFDKIKQLDKVKKVRSFIILTFAIHIKGMQYFEEFLINLN